MKSKFALYFLCVWTYGSVLWQGCQIHCLEHWIGQQDEQYFSKIQLATENHVEFK